MDIKGFLILFLLYACSTSKKVTNDLSFFTVISVTKDIELVDDRITSYNKDLLTNQYDSLSVKKINILFSDGRDSVLVKGKNDSIQIIKLSNVSDTLVDIELIESSFTVNSYNHYFKNAYWANVEYIYTYDNSTHSKLFKIEY